MNLDQLPTSTAQAVFIRHPLADDYFTEAEWAAIRGIKVPTLRAIRARRQSDAPVTKIGRDCLYRKQSAQAWLLAQEFDPKAIRRTRNRAA